MKLVLLLIFFSWLSGHGEVNINLTDQYKDIATRLALKKTKCNSSCPLVEYVSDQKISSIEGVSILVEHFDNSTFLFKKKSGNICQIMLTRSLPMHDSNVKEIETSFDELNQKLIKKYGKPENIDSDFYPSRTITWDRNKNWKHTTLELKYYALFR